MTFYIIFIYGAQDSLLAWCLGLLWLHSSLILLLDILFNQFFFLVLADHPVMVLVICDFRRDFYLWMLLVPIEEEEISVKYWLRWRLFSIFELWCFSSFQRCLVIIIFVDFILVFSFEFLLCLS